MEKHLPKGMESAGVAGYGYRGPDHLGVDAETKDFPVSNHTVADTGVKHSGRGHALVQNILASDYRVAAVGLSALMVILLVYSIFIA